MQRLLLLNARAPIKLTMKRATLSIQTTTLTLTLAMTWAALVGGLTLAGCSDSSTDDRPDVATLPDDATFATAQKKVATQGGDAAIDVAPAKPKFILGTNVTGKSTPEYFSEVPKNAQLNVEFGPQGLWMVVLAFKTRELLQPPLLLSGRVEIAGKKLGELKLGKQKLLPGDGGYSYYYNFFLVVAPEGVAGKKATIHFTATGKDGPQVDIEHPVVLTGGK